MNRIKNILGSLTLVAVLAQCGSKPSETKEVTEESEVRHDIGVQLYTIRDAMSANPITTLEKVSKIGYNQIELAGYDAGTFYGFESQRFLEIADSLNLDIISTHVPLEALRADLELVIGQCQKAGIKYIVLPWLNGQERETIVQYETLVDELNAIGEACLGAGIAFVYHNHDFEFMTLEGQLPMELILEKTNPEFVNVELDLYWATKAGFDPVTLFKKYPNRFPLWHVKDMDNTAEKKFTEIGKGIIDFSRIFEQAETAGMQYFFVEQDVSADPLKSIEISFGNVKKLL